MYQIKFASKSLYKKFEAIVKSLRDKKGYCELEDILTNYPKGNPQTHRKIEKKIDYWGYDLSWGDRVTYKVYDKERTVIVYFIGNHKDYETFLKRYGKKKN